MRRKIKVVAGANTTGAAREETSFTVRAGNMRYTIKVNQDKDPWLTWSVPELYVMDSDYKAIDISANFPWMVAEIDPNNKYIISIETPSGEATTQKDVIFRTFNHYEKLKNGIKPPDGKYVEESTTIVFKDPLGVNVDKTVEMMLVCPVDFGEANCYMIDANNPRPVRIPLSQVERAMGKLPVSVEVDGQGFLGSDWIQNMDDLRAQVFWSEQSDGSGLALTGTDESILRRTFLRNKGTLAESDIIIVPGSGSGNCGVILYETPMTKKSSPKLM